MTATITFHGATGTVTGSRYLIDTGKARVLVDCGLFQGYRRLRERNWAALPFAPASLDAIVLTHAHIDHSGYLPRLCLDGFTGRVYCSRATQALLHLLLPDSGYLQEEDARRANRYGYSRHHPALPLYTRDEAVTSLARLEPIEFHEPTEIAAGVSALLTPAGHILGSACARLQVGGRAITFTGDVGRPVDPIMRPAEPLGPTDFLVTESTYGDRLHPSEDVEDELAVLVRERAADGGVILVPAFAVGRAQHLLHIVARLKARDRIPDIPVFLDSPMAINATQIFCAHRYEHRLSETECRAMCTAASYSRTPEESKAIDRRTGPMIVISASGMLTGGRILHHLRRFLPGENNAVVLVGFQAAGTRGRALLDGAPQIKLHGQFVDVKAKIVRIGGLSAHADWRELLDWFTAGALSPRQVFVTHGEPAAANAFRERLAESMGWNAVVPADKSSWVLDEGLRGREVT